MTITRLGITTRRLPGPRIPDLTDPDALAAVRAGDRDAFAAVVNRHNQTMFRASRAALGNGHDAMDTMQTAWVDAFRTLDGFSTGTLRSWVTKIALEAASKRRRKSSGSVLDGGTVLESALDDLPDALRTVLVLSDVIRLEPAETAACLEIDEDNVRVRLHRARQTLAQRLADPTLDLVAAAHDVWRFDGDRAANILLQVMTRIVAISSGPSSTPP